MAFRLALALGWPSVAWGLQHISSRELTEWVAFAQLEPFGEERADLRAGIIAATVANTARDRKQRARAFRPEEFMPKFGERSNDWETMLARVELLNAAFGGVDKRRREGG